MNWQFPRLCLIAWLAVGGVTQVLLAQVAEITNFGRRPCSQELARLAAQVPQEAFVVTENNVEIPYQIEEIDGRRWIWVCADYAPEQTRKFEIVAGRQPKAFEPKVKLTFEQDQYLLDNGEAAIRCPARAHGPVPGPITAMRMDKKWIGSSAWNTSARLKSLTATVIGNGTLFAKLRLRYEFEGKPAANLFDDGEATSQFSEIDLRLAPGHKHVEIFERHRMSYGDGWLLELSANWAPNEGLSRRFSGGFGPGAASAQPRQRPLKPGGLPLAKPELFINMFPRWNQHYKDGWTFAASDGQGMAGATVVRASRWIWPHSNSIEAIVKESGSYAALRLPTWKGQRLWWLFAGWAEPQDVGYIAAHAWEHLDKLNHEIIASWPGRPMALSGMNLYDSGQMNPTGGLRGAGRGAIAAAAREGDVSTLTRAQLMLHPDAWGSYWTYWSPENSNFYTDFMKVPVALTAQLRGHPRFEELRRQAELRLREDIYHSVTLPGGAGQECPGYLRHALSGWSQLAPVCKQYLGFDPRESERYKAAQVFLARISQPDGEVRRDLPIGDTHPGREGPGIVNVEPDAVKAFATEELPGFGVIFNHRPGTPQETYLSFKSGPNRGHYHGDQLSVHLCAKARPLAVDHHCSYGPHAAQEHMHNRLAFSTEQFEYANMDGYERLIAFKSSPQADLAVGQVESMRLRRINKHPPADWHGEYPQEPMDSPLTYQRTVVFVKGDTDYIVLRDQFRAPKALTATFNLHVRSDSIRHEGGVVDFGKLSLHCVQPAQVTFESFPWSHTAGGGEFTQGARLSTKAQAGQFITVLYPGTAPTIKSVPSGVAVGDDQVLFGVDELTAGDDQQHVRVLRKGEPVVSLSGKDINLDRSQGQIGLFVPDAGYPFGEIPAWLVRQRATRPADWTR